ncbi:hypothetical protein AM1_5898 [Acaryochloris marina MBIC11017]|uniref:Uncharacterized protein n=1 Tax=Acaryochloris marina (strain MBIC 11017) TaxID=329726 RepID=B0C1K3_ACAM1|nr:hypothetical protein AM1_5898 [Acaryochloris marina MBIC11017]
MILLLFLSNLFGESTTLNLEYLFQKEILHPFVEFVVR